MLLNKALRTIHTSRITSLAFKRTILRHKILPNISLFQHIKPRFQSTSNNQKSEESWPTAIAYILAAGTSLYMIYKMTFHKMDIPMGLLYDAAPHPHPLKWSHHGAFNSYDCASIRRGYHVYRQVCSTCHGMGTTHFYDLINVTHTKEQVKEIAKATLVEDGPNDKGEMYKRPALIKDEFPKPYKNEEHARYANGGAYPPSLERIVSQREFKEDYIFALLTGYNDPPHGIEKQEGKNWNTYFEGGWISMPNPLPDDGLVDYEDGTPATQSQMAKDVTTFLTWASNKKSDELKQKGLVASCACFASFACLSVMLRNYSLKFKNELSFWKKPAKF